MYIHRTLSVALLGMGAHPGSRLSHIPSAPPPVSSARPSTTAAGRRAPTSSMSSSGAVALSAGAALSNRSASERVKG